MVCTRENAPGVKEASLLDLSSISEDLPKADDSSGGVSLADSYMCVSKLQTSLAPLLQNSI